MSILEAAYTIRCHFEPHNLESIGGFVSLLPSVDLAGIVKNKQQLNFLPGEGPRNVIASVETSTAEAREALKESQLRLLAGKAPQDPPRVEGRMAK